MPLKIAYWQIRGLAQPIRLMLEYVGEDYEDKQYETGGPPDFSRDNWLNEKFTLGLDFPNLPYLIDGEIKITQSNAIMRYVARKHGLCGSTELARAQVDMMADQIMDLRNGAVRLFYNKAFNEMKEGYLKDLKTKYEAFEKFLGDKPWLCGNEITFPDFHFYEMLDQHRMLEQSTLDNFPKLKAYLDRFEVLPKIKAYMASDKFMKGPINNKMAAWK